MNIFKIFIRFSMRYSKQDEKKETKTRRKRDVSPSSLAKRVKTHKRNVGLTNAEKEIMDKKPSQEGGPLQDPKKSTIWNRLDEDVRQRLVQLHSALDRG
jgi:hypothetical protein